MSSQPALFDLQVNGFAGVDFQQAALTQVELRHAVDGLRAHETHRILLTPDAEFSGGSVTGVLARILADLQAPTERIA